MDKFDETKQFMEALARSKAELSGQPISYEVRYGSDCLKSSSLEFCAHFHAQAPLKECVDAVKGFYEELTEKYKESDPS